MFARRTALISAKVALAAVQEDESMSDSNDGSRPVALSPPLILRTSVWRKERIRKGRNLAETNPGGPRRVHLLLSRPAGFPGMMRTFRLTSPSIRGATGHECVPDILPSAGASVAGRGAGAGPARQTHRLAGRCHAGRDAHRLDGGLHHWPWLGGGAQPECPARGQTG